MLQNNILKNYIWENEENIYFFSMHIPFILKLVKGKIHSESFAAKSARICDNSHAGIYIHLEVCHVAQKDVPNNIRLFMRHLSCHILKLYSH